MNRRWLAFGAAILAIAILGTAGAVSGNKTAGSLGDRSKKHASDERRPGLGHSKDKHAGPRGKGFGNGRWAGLMPLLQDEKAREAIGAAIAKALGMSPEELRATLKEDDRDIEDLLKAKGVAVEQLGAAVAAAAGPHLERLVVSGAIERDDADQILEHLAKGAWIGKLARLSGITGG